MEGESEVGSLGTSSQVLSEDQQSSGKSLPSRASSRQLDDDTSVADANERKSSVKATRRRSSRQQDDVKSTGDAAGRKSSVGATRRRSSRQQDDVKSQAVSRRSSRQQDGVKAKADDAGEEEEEEPEKRIQAKPSGTQQGAKSLNPKIEEKPSTVEMVTIQEDFDEEEDYEEDGEEQEEQEEEIEEEEIEEEDEEEEEYQEEEEEVAEEEEDEEEEKEEDEEEEEESEEESEAKEDELLKSRASSLLEEVEEEEEAEQEEEQEEQEEAEREEERDMFRVETESERAKLIRTYQMAKEENKRLREANLRIQRTLLKHYQSRDKTEAEAAALTEQEASDFEMKYAVVMAKLFELRAQREKLHRQQMAEIEHLKALGIKQRAAAENALKNSINFRRNIVTRGQKNRKSSRYKKAEQYSQMEYDKWAEVSKITLDNIVIKENQDYLLRRLKERETVTEGLTLAHFRQLKIVNQTFNEKIETKNEDVSKFRLKLKSVVEKVTHVKQKLEFVQGEVEEELDKIQELEEAVVDKRQLLVQAKLVRDRLRREGKALRRKNGLLCYPDLLRDYEKKIDESDELKIDLSELKIRHNGMTQQVRRLTRKTVELIKTGTLKH